MDKHTPIAAKVASSSSEIFSGREDDDCIEATPHHVKRPSTVTSDSDVEKVIPARQMAVRPRMKWTCYKCLKGSRFTPKEICIVCSAECCYKCVVRAMGSMPEGRKCIGCIGLRINEARRANLGKSSRVLKQLFSPIQVKQIMLAEKSCKVNQLPGNLVNVNSQPLSQQELFELQTCKFPPKKLEPGHYWYDKVSGFWGKKGQKPCQMISPELNIGGRISKEASNGNTNVFINTREITKTELLMLQLLGVKCGGGTHFWVSADGSYQEEGMKNVKGKIWEKNRAKLVCNALSLPMPPCSIDVLPSPVRPCKLFLVGSGKSGSSTIFKHAKIIYNIPFSEEDRKKIKFMIQRNLYGYLGILVKGCQQFEEESLIKKKRHLHHCSSSDNSSQVDSESMYTISPNLKPFSDELLKFMVSGNLEAIFPAANSKYGPFVEELWNDAAIQATYSRKDELEMLPEIATYFLERAIEVSKKDYGPSEMDILYAEGTTSSNGPSSMEFSFPFPREGTDNFLFYEHRRYQLIRMDSRLLRGKYKCLEMFEDVDMVLFCVSLIDYDEYVEDSNGVRTNKMMATKQMFERLVTHPKLKGKKFLLILNKFDLFKKKIEQFPLNRCEWFNDFNLVIEHIPSGSNAPLAQRAFQYIAVKFKRLFSSPKGGKPFASLVTAFDPVNVDEALRYAKVILEEGPIEISSSSIDGPI